MEQLILLIFDLGLLLIYSSMGFIIFMIIQLISYQVFKFNIYKWLIYNLFERWL